MLTEQLLDRGTFATYLARIATFNIPQFMPGSVAAHPHSRMLTDLCFSCDMVIKTETLFVQHIPALDRFPAVPLKQIVAPKLSPSLGADFYLLTIFTGIN